MVDEKRWGILYCPKGGVLSSPQKRWERVEACLKAHNIDFDMVQSESSADDRKWISHYCYFWWRLGT